jgi:hypothetical protein
MISGPPAVGSGQFQPEIRNSESEIRNPESVGSGQLAVSSPNPESEIRNPESVGGGQLAVSSPNPESEIRNPESEIRNPESVGGRQLAVGGHNPESEIRNPESVGGGQSAVGGLNPKPETRNPEPGTMPAPTRKHTVAKLGSLESMLEDQIKVSDMEDAAYAPDMNPESLKKAWLQYAAGISSDSSRTFLRQVELSIDHQHITATVNSALAESTIKQEMGVIEYLRSHFRRSGLTLSIKVEKKAQADDEPAPRATPLNDKEKLRQMQQTNPHLKTLWERLGLGIEGDGG